MLRITCPHCGPRDEIEFRYRGDASLSRPGPEDDAKAFQRYAYERENPAGMHLEWWLHVGGCRRALKLQRDTASHVIGGAGEP